MGSGLLSGIFIIGGSAKKKKKVPILKWQLCYK